MIHLKVGFLFIQMFILLMFWLRFCVNSGQFHGRVWSENDGCGSNVRRFWNLVKELGSELVASDKAATVNAGHVKALVDDYIITTFKAYIRHLFCIVRYI